MRSSKNTVMMYAVLIFLTLQVAAVQSFSQTNDTTVSPQAAEELAIYGEVQKVDPASRTVTVQYYDYDSDEEKSIDIVTDNTTKIENAASLADIKTGDWADVTYAASSGKNIAKDIIVEKEETVVESEEIDIYEEE